MCFSPMEDLTDLPSREWKVPELPSFSLLSTNCRLILLLMTTC